MDYRVGERLEQTDGDRKWPWDYQKENLTETTLTEIMENLPSYACDAVNWKPEEVGMPEDLYGVFQIYCKVVKDHFQQAVERSPASVKQELSAIANDAFGLVDLLLEWVEKQIRRREGDFNMRYLPIDYPCSYTQISTRWDSVVLKFKMCVSFGEQPAETEESAAHEGESWWWKLYEKTLKVIVDAVMERWLPK